MADNRYDIFISYRRDGGAQYARILQLELEKRGYKVFLDYEELTDGVFGDNIKEAIREAPVFMMVLSAHYLDRCKNEGDWVREEILLAIKQQKHFIPINPDNSFDGISADIPEDIKQLVGSHQHSEVNFGQLLGASIDRMVKSRIANNINVSAKPRKKLISFIVAAVFVLAAIIGAFFYIESHNTQRITELKVETALDGQQYLNWSDDITLEQLEAINHILGNMVQVEGGTYMMGATLNPDSSYDEDVDVDLETPPMEQNIASFWMCKYEVSVSEWCRVMGVDSDNQKADSPMSDVTYDDCEAFCEKLNNLTGLEFRLPSEAEWELAARGGGSQDSTKYAGSNSSEEVAWYRKNSNGKPHICNATNSPMRPNGANLYDMSGNISEWCSTDFRPYNTGIPSIDAEAKVIRGGNYDSEPFELTVYHREPMNVHEKAPTVGLRLVIGK